ncbi:MAG: twin-arginine translocation signal domain-containing protein, partial [Acidobacteria bacterium]|nr:twin-arginine translocation signal domain-containing protein [Acidobacteriota bacterium]
MKKKAQWAGRNLSRRQFVQAGAAGAAALGAAASGAPAVQSSGPKPVVIASGNGNRYKNGG